MSTDSFLKIGVGPWDTRKQYEKNNENNKLRAPRENDAKAQAELRQMASNPGVKAAKKQKEAGKKRRRGNRRGRNDPTKEEELRSKRLATRAQVLAHASANPPEHLLSAKEQNKRDMRAGNNNNNN